MTARVLRAQRDTYKERRVTAAGEKKKTPKQKRPQFDLDHPAGAGRRIPEGRQRKAELRETHTKTVREETRPDALFHVDVCAWEARL